VLETQSGDTRNLLECTKVGGSEYEIPPGWPSPTPTHCGTRNSTERKHDLANWFDLLIGANLHADVIRRSRNAPLNVQPIAIEAQQPVNRLAGGRDLQPTDDITRPAKHERKRRGMGHGSSYTMVATFSP
jgi:hypothetical protein